LTVIHKIRLKISNCYLVEGEKRILVDTGSPGESENIIHQLKSLGVGLQDISLILHTHGHSDHCGSTTELIKHHKIPTAIHSADSHMTENGKNDYLKTTRLIAKFIRPFVDKPFPAFKADFFIDDYHDLTSFGVIGLIHSTKGHTNGSISIEFDNRESIIGDVIMGGFMGGELFPHLPDYHYFADNLNDIKESISKILNFKSDKFYVGHGGPITRERIEKRFK
jgi:glyoxylase-like metal-dependent hydrolase (beta-lactamase superfamily II)